MDELAFRASAQQRGAVLVVGLIFLALLTLMGATAYMVATQEERMAGNARDRIRAFEAAEMALRECEGRINAGTAVFSAVNTGTAGASGPFYLRPTYPTLSPIDNLIALAPNQAIGAGVALQAVDKTVLPNDHDTTNAEAEWSNTPQCIAEAFDVRAPGVAAAGQPPPTTRMYRIVGIGWGLNPGSRVMLVSTYGS